MGYDAYSIEITMTIDNHGDERGERDRALVEDLRKRIEELCKDEKYADIAPVVY